MGRPTPVNVGASANDGNGDTLRASMQTVNLAIADYVSQTETSDQAIASNLTLGDDKVLALVASTNSDTQILTAENLTGMIASFNLSGTGFNFKLGDATYNFIVKSSTNANLMKVTGAGIVSMDTYGAGDTQFLSGGVLTSVSDSKYKNHTRDFEYGGAEINAISDMMGFYKFNDKGPHAGDTTEYASFYADQIAEVMPEAAPLNTRYVKEEFDTGEVDKDDQPIIAWRDTAEIDDTWHSLNTRPIIMALVKAHKDQSGELAESKSEIADLKSELAAIKEHLGL